MTTIVGIISLLALVVGAFLALASLRGRPAVGQLGDETPDESVGFGAIEQQGNFNPARSLFIFGPEKNDPECTQQRRVIKPLLATMLERHIAIVEIYGDRAPSRNGQVVDWLDTEILRQTLNAQVGFHLIYVNESGRASFHSIDILSQPAIALLLDLPQTEQNPASFLDNLANSGSLTDSGAEAPPSVAENVLDAPQPTDEPAWEENEHSSATMEGLADGADQAVDPINDEAPPLPLSDEESGWEPWVEGDGESDDPEAAPESAEEAPWVNEERTFVLHERQQMRIADDTISSDSHRSPHEEEEASETSPMEGLPNTQKKDRIFAPLASENTDTSTNAEERKAPDPIARAVKKRFQP